MVLLCEGGSDFNVSFITQDNVFGRIQRGRSERQTEEGRLPCDLWGPASAFGKNCSGSMFDAPQGPRSNGKK